MRIWRGFEFENLTFYRVYMSSLSVLPPSLAASLIANLYMEHFEHKARTTYVRPPDIWFRYVDDTFCKLHEYDVEDFTTHLNSVDPHIQFTSEPEEKENLLFWILVSV